jgi:hypothetical protein
MGIVLAILSWLIWLAISALSGWVFYMFVRPRDISPPQWVVDIFPIANLVCIIDACLALIGVIVSIILVL